jgi:ABC-type nitrate/sulfonate/bicarbonate transport system substrate-binding protein
MRLFAFLLLFLIFLPARALETVRVQLNWKHQFQFAGYYAAIEKGYFRAAGFEVSLQELAAGGDPVQAVLAGEADFGVAASELALYRGRGHPVVVPCRHRATLAACPVGQPAQDSQCRCAA